MRMVVYHMWQHILVMRKNVYVLAAPAYLQHKNGRTAFAVMMLKAPEKKKSINPAVWQEPPPGFRVQKLQPLYGQRHCRPPRGVSLVLRAPSVSVCYPSFYPNNGDTELPLTIKPLSQISKGDGGGSGR